MFVTAIVFAVLALIGLILWRFVFKVKTWTEPVRGAYGQEPSERVVTAGSLAHTIAGWVTIILAALALVFLVFSSFYTQQEGTANVEVDVTGKAIRAETEAGFHLKWPWINTVEFNIRNQPVAFGGSAEDFRNNQGAGYAFDGPQITVNTSDGVKVNQDAQVTYSIKPDAVLDIYRDWKTEDAFKEGLIYQDIRNTVREEGNTRTTLALITGIAKFGSDIDSALTEKWTETGVVVNQVNLQEPRPPQSVTDAYALAQEAEINISTEESKLAAAKVSTQTRVAEATADADAARIRAQGEADANSTVNASLTPAILQKLLIDAYDEGTVYVTDGSSNILLGAR